MTGNATERVEAMRAARASAPRDGSVALLAAALANDEERQGLVEDLLKSGPTVRCFGESLRWLEAEGVDARDALRALDRPLFADFWERFLACLTALREKRQRTVYRLTLVKSWNMEEVENYVSLIEVGDPDLIEIKAVTYCGTSDASSLTMQNVPWHEEVVEFGRRLEAELSGPASAGEAKDVPQYGLACEHAHS